MHIRALTSRGRVAAAASAALAAALLATGCGGDGNGTDLTAAPTEAPAGPTESEGFTVTADQRAPAQGTTGNVTVTESSVIIGDPDAPEKVHIYIDLNCPHCHMLHDEMAADTAAWAEGSDVAVEYTVVDYLCPRTTHLYSSRGANLLALVADVDPESWLAVQDALLAGQPASTTDQVTTEWLIETARDAGATLDDDDIAAQEQLAYTDWVQGATAEAAAAGVNFIPQVWIDGAQVTGESHEETAQLVREAVAAADL
ncbi:MAG TPA: thioredoxin domain-containing protein [Actinomycetaceae bacterium]|nr:thioredoxin domain-containing protein [Actinomycetaceae bacterium]